MRRNGSKRWTSAAYGTCGNATPAATRSRRWRAFRRNSARANRATAPPQQALRQCQENGRGDGGGGGGVTPMTRPPAEIALPGRSITQSTVLPGALAAWPTNLDTGENTTPTG